MSGSLKLSAWCLAAAFGSYFCIYAFRRPFTAAPFVDITVWGVDYKTVLIVSQVFGYTVSKFLGIKVVAEAPPHRRVAMLLGLAGCAELTLILFGVTPPPYNAICLFCNGIPLGMVFGLVLSFLEGRQRTEALVAGLCASFIIADGTMKSVGAGLLQAGIPEVWMPAMTGGLFMLPLLFFAWMLARIPQPSLEDVVERSERTPMNGSERWALFNRHALGLSVLIVINLLMTILRSLRADFAPEIWARLQQEISPATFAGSEIVVAVCVLSICASSVLLRENRLAFFLGLSLAGGGMILLLISLIAFHAELVSPFPFMVLLGTGLYLPYIVIHTTIFERLLAMTRERGNIAFLSLLADSVGYLGYIGVLLSRPAIDRTENFLNFFLFVSWATALTCLFLLIGCWRYFGNRLPSVPPEPVSESIESEATVIECNT